MRLKIIDQQEVQTSEDFEILVNTFMDEVVIINVKIHNSNGLMRALILYKNFNS